MCAELGAEVRAISPAAASPLSAPRSSFLVVPAAAGYVPAERVARWLRFAAGRVAGELVLFMPRPLGMHPDELEVLLHGASFELPACERAKAIALRLKLVWRLRLGPAGSFAALTSLTILL